MNKITIFLFIIIAALSFNIGTALQGNAQNKTFAGVIPFVTTNDRVGFFDQGSGRVYMYDNNINECLFIGQVTELGKAIEPIAKS